MKNEVSLDRLNDQLTKSAKLLDACADLIRDLELSPGDNITRIGEALVNIFEIQRQIYEQRPDLAPDYLHG